MELKLNIYGKNKKGVKCVVKTHVAKDYEVEFGTLEDILEVAEAYSNKSTEEELTRIIVSSMQKIKPLLLDVFDGLTEEELRHVKASDIILIVVQIVQYGLASLTGLGGNSKNA